MKLKKIPQTILIVEDDAPVRQALADKLTRAGFAVAVAKNGIEGLSAAKKLHPDLILLDILMPKMDGLTMMKKLRATSDWAKKIPIILLTNVGPDEGKIMKKTIADGSAYYLVKTNWSLSAVVEKIRECLLVKP